MRSILKLEVERIFCWVAIKFVHFHFKRFGSVENISDTREQRTCAGRKPSAGDFFDPAGIRHRPRREGLLLEMAAISRIAKL